MTKADLIGILSKHSDDAVIMNQRGEDFIHMVNMRDGTITLSSEKPIGVCNRTGGYVYPTDTPGYAGYCPELDEDLYAFEFEASK